MTCPSVTIVLMSWTTYEDAKKLLVVADPVIVVVV